MNPLKRSSGCKIEGPEINCLVLRLPDSVKGDPHKTFLENIFASHIKLNSAVGELIILQPCDPGSCIAVKMCKLDTVFTKESYISVNDRPSVATNEFIEVRLEGSVILRTCEQCCVKVSHNACH